MDKFFTAEKVKDLRQELNKAIASFAVKNGLEVHFGDAKYDPITATFQVKVTHIPSEDFDPIQALWEVHCGRIGFAPGDMGKEFITDAMSVKAGLGKLQAKATTPPTPEEIQKEKEEETRKAKTEWDLNCWRTGLAKEDFGKTVVLNGHLFRICGFRPNAKTNDIRILDVKWNKEYVTSHDTIKKALSGSAGQ